MEGTLIAKYNDVLMSDSRVRKLMKTIVQDPTTETQDNNASKAALLELLRDDASYLGEPRRAIIAWLNECYYSVLTRKFWFEMHTRMHKILTVSIVLEGQNLRKFGVEKPKKSDIPTAITHLYNEMIIYRTMYLKSDLAEYDSLVNSPQLSHFTDLYI